MSVVNQPAIAAHPFLRGMPAELIAAVAAQARDVSLPVGQRLFEEGGLADRFWLITAGQVALDTYLPGDGRLIIETLGRGDVLGLSWLLPPYQWRFGAVTRQPTRAYEFSAAGVRAAMAADCALAAELNRRFLGVAVHRLQATRNRLLDPGRPGRTDLL
jgi:CRP/FNR family transcriptional regulator, cyclic AMP receptor protein